MSKAFYVSPDAIKTNHHHRKMITTFFVTLLSLLFASVTIMSGVGQQNREAHADDIVKGFMCSGPFKESTAGLYQMSQSNDLWFALNSKSAITSGLDDVTNGLNSVIDLTKPDDRSFQKINEAILGRELDGLQGQSESNGNQSTSATAPSNANFNKGTYVNPYDRFGVAGLKWSGYQGEWEYIIIDACGNSQPKDSEANMFYEKRLQPRSTWENINNSKDIRTQQFSSGFFLHYNISIADFFSNGIFWLTKLFVSFTIALIGFSLTDISAILGIDKIIAGSPGHEGLFNILFNGIFTPLIVIVMAITGLMIAYKGIVQRQFRNAIGMLVKTLLMFFLAIFCALKPAIFIALPNNIATVMESVVLTSMNSGLQGGNGLCSTNIGQFNTNLVNDENAKETDILKEASTNMQSVVGCQFWYTFLFKPWVQGQFGTDWNQVWAKNKIADWAPAGAKSITNGDDNAKMVGDATVPLGDGKVINNWAIFDVSVDTNAHSPIGQDGKPSKYTNGVANDWWRIVDAFANYEEGQQTESSSVGDQNYSYSYNESKNNPPLQEWSTWTGNNSWERIGVALTSLIVAVVGLLGPMTFSSMSAIYSIGISLLMALAPIMLLLGCWAGRGFSIFKSWGQLVINTTLKRIVLALLLIVSIAITITAIRLMDSLGWWQGILLLILFSVIIYKSKDKIISALQINIAENSFSHGASKIGHTAASVSKGSVYVATSAGVGGVAAKRHGGSFVKGAAAAFKNDMSDRMWSNPVTRHIASIVEAQKGFDDDNPSQTVCTGCKRNLTYDNVDGMGGVNAAIDPYGNLWCRECFDSGKAPKGTRELVLNGTKRVASAYSDDAAKQTVYRLKQDANRFNNAKNNNDAEDNNNTVDRPPVNSPSELDKPIKIDNNSVNISRDQQTVILTQVARLAGTADTDMDNYVRYKSKEIPEIPQEIAPYIQGRQLALVKIAYENLRDPDKYESSIEYIKQIYRMAWFNWAVTLFGDNFLETLEGKDNLKKFNSFDQKVNRFGGFRTDESTVDRAGKREYDI